MYLHFGVFNVDLHRSNGKVEYISIEYLRAGMESLGKNKPYFGEKQVRIGHVKVLCLRNKEVISYGNIVH